MTTDNRTMAEVIADMREYTDALEMACQRTHGLQREMLMPSGPVADLIEALASADDHAEANFVRWPRNVSSDHPDYPYRKGTECFDDWGRACAEKDAAVCALLNYAFALRAAKVAP